MEFKIQRGESAEYFWSKFDTEAPEIHVVPGSSPKQTYLWVGGENGPCYATLSGKETLRKLAHEILEAIGEKP